jgi:hypothetical protein
MQTIGPPAGNGHIDNILVQAQGSTGDHTDRKGDFNEAMQDSGEVKAPEVNKAAKYDGQWKGM